VFELLILNEQVKDAILNKRTSYEIRRISIETSGMVTLLEDGLAKAASGQTTIAEVLRHLPRLDKPRPLKEINRLTGLK
jgi:type IV pilus assembly protein PilB